MIIKPPFWRHPDSHLPSALLPPAGAASNTGGAQWTTPGVGAGWAVQEGGGERRRGALG